MYRHIIGAPSVAGFVGGLHANGMVENLDEGDPEIFYFKRLR